MAKSTQKWPGPEYHVQTVFRAPLAYVFSWCTDYDPDDARRERDHYARRIIRRAGRRVVFEDLADSGGGWSWSRFTVSLLPPDHWHCESVGSHRDLTLDYHLTPLPGDRTRLDLRWKRRRTALGEGRLSKRTVERATTAGWRHFAHELEKDYRRSRTGRGR